MTQSTDSPLSLMSREDKQALMRWIKLLAAIYDECTSPEENSSGLYRATGANLFGNHSANGLFLELHYSRPRMLWTPWGQWHIAAGYITPSELRNFFSRLKFREEIPVRYSALGEHGPVYAILAVDEVELPEPKLLEQPFDPNIYRPAPREWRELYETVVVD